MSAEVALLVKYYILFLRLKTIKKNYYARGFLISTEVGQLNA